MPNRIAQREIFEQRKQNNERDSYRHGGGRAPQNKANDNTESERRLSRHATRSLKWNPLTKYRLHLITLREINQREWLTHNKRKILVYEMGVSRKLEKQS